MSTKANHFKIGVFVIAALALLVIGLMAFGARSYFEKKTTFETAIAGDVYGLSIGSPVELRGVPIGKVTKIAFIWNEYPKSKTNFVIIEFEAEGNISPKQDGPNLQVALGDETKRGLRAMVKSQGITGTSLLALQYLNPAKNPVLAIDYKPRHFYIPSALGQVTRMLESIENSLQSFQQLDLAGIGRSVTNALGTASLLAEKLDKLDLQKLSVDADALIVELRATSVALQSTLGEIQKTIKGMKLEGISQNADGLLLGLRESNTKLQAVLNHVGAVPLQETVGDIRQAVNTLNTVLSELKQYPSGFIFGAPPPPAKSVKIPAKQP